ncbi:hypothetical protein [Bacteroides faecis]|uniref:hypothetical protein n=1 Tax=Bacteroides faecis TaxID=674529 RepID=UPI003562F265
MSKFLKSVAHENRRNNRMYKTEQRLGNYACTIKICTLDGYIGLCDYKFFIGWRIPRDVGITGGISADSTVAI